MFSTPVSSDLTAIPDYLKSLLFDTGITLVVLRIFSSSTQNVIRELFSPLIQICEIKLHVHACPNIRKVHSFDMVKRTVTNIKRKRFL